MTGLEWFVYLYALIYPYIVLHYHLTWGMQRLERLILVLKLNNLTGE